MFCLGMKFFREKIHHLLVEMDTFEFFDERHYFATFLHLKHRDMSKFAQITSFSNCSVNILYFELIELLSADRKFEILTRLRSILSNMKLISGDNGTIDSSNEDRQRKRFKWLNKYIADFEDEHSSLWKRLEINSFI